MTRISTFVLWLVAAAVGMAAAQGNPPKAQRFDYLVRADFFAGAAGDEARLARVMEVCEKALAENPAHAEALVWHGAGLLVRAGRAFQRGDMSAGGPLFDRGLKEMNDAAALAPDNPGVLIPRGAVLFEATRNMAPAMARPLLQSAVQNYERALEIQAAGFGALGDHAKGELLFGLAEGWSRLGDAARARPVLRAAHRRRAHLGSGAESTRVDRYRLAADDERRAVRRLSQVAAAPRLLNRPLLEYRPWPSTTTSRFSAAASPADVSRGSSAWKRRSCACWSPRSGRIRCPRRRSRSASRASRSARITFRSASSSSRTCAAQQLEKLGLRYFFPHGDNRDITARVELGPPRFPPVPSFQLDRGRLENYAAARRTPTLGVDGARRLPRAGDRARRDGAHRVSLSRAPTARAQVHGAVGRRRERPRGPAEAPARAGARRARTAPTPRGGASARASRSTTGRTTRRGRRACRRACAGRAPIHLMGVGYWVWLIPLGSGSHQLRHRRRRRPASVRAHQPLRARARLAARVRAAVRGGRWRRTRTSSRTSSRCSTSRTAARACSRPIAGRSSAKPASSPIRSTRPGSDFIAMGNDYVTDLIVRDARGEDIARAGRGVQRRPTCASSTPSSGSTTASTRSWATRR